MAIEETLKEAHFYTVWDVTDFLESRIDSCKDETIKAQYVNVKADITARFAQICRESK